MKNCILLISECMMLSKFFSFPYLSVYDIDIAWFAFRLGCIHTSRHTYENPETLVPSLSVQPCKKHSINVIWEKKTHHAWMSLKCFAFYSSILFFSLFSRTLSLILALDSGKRRVVVVVVLGNISCEWCPSLVTTELLFNSNPTPVKLLTQTTSHPLYIDVLQCCCYFFMW